MSIELISVLVAVVAIGATLGGLILTSTRGLRLDMRDMRQDMAQMESRLDERISGLESRLDERISGLESRLDGSIKALESRFDAMESQFGELRERMAHLEGLLEGLREAITGRVKAS